IAQASTGSVPSRRNQRQGLSSRSKRYSPRRHGSNAKKLSRLAISRRRRRRQGNVGAAAGYAFWRTATEGERLRTRRHRRRLRHPADVAAGLADGGGVLYSRRQACRRERRARVNVGPGTLSPMEAYADRREAKALTHRQTLLIVLGVLLPTFMGSLDQTILATALPTIGRDFGDVHSLPWLITAYLLASTAIIPLYGKVADIHGRRFTLRIAILTYMAGSLVCALAPTMLVLIFGRVLHGLGGGGLSSMGMIVLGDLVSPKERGRSSGFFAVTSTPAGGLGPLLGGLIAEHLHWSVIFWMNIPMGLAALAITTSLLRKLPRHERPHRLDVVGGLLIVTASVSFMLAMNTAGGHYAWTSPPILALFAVALIVGTLFVLR